MSEMIELTKEGSCVALTLKGPLNDLLEEFRPLPSFKDVSTVKFNFIQDYKQRTTKAQLEIVVYGGVIRWYVEYYDIYFHTIEAQNEVVKFRDLLTRFNTYISIPFNRLPLILPIDRSTPQYNLFNNLIRYRLRLGV